MLVDSSFDAISCTNWIYRLFQVVQEYERAVIFRLGRLMAGGAKGPGTHIEHIIFQMDRVFVAHAAWMMGSHAIANDSPHFPWLKHPIDCTVHKWYFNALVCFHIIYIWLSLSKVYFSSCLVWMRMRVWTYAPELMMFHHKRYVCHIIHRTRIAQ